MHLISSFHIYGTSNNKRMNRVGRFYRKRRDYTTVVFYVGLSVGYVLMIAFKHSR